MIVLTSAYLKVILIIGFTVKHVRLLAAQSSLYGAHESTATSSTWVLILPSSFEVTRRRTSKLDGIILVDADGYNSSTDPQYEVLISVTQGYLSISSVEALRGVTFRVGDGNFNAEMSFHGNYAETKQALEGLTFTHVNAEVQGKNRLFFSVELSRISQRNISTAGDLIPINILAPRGTKEGLRTVRADSYYRRMDSVHPSEPTILCQFKEYGLCYLPLSAAVALGICVVGFLGLLTIMWLKRRMSTLTRFSKRVSSHDSSSPKEEQAPSTISSQAKAIRAKPISLSEVAVEALPRSDTTDTRTLNSNVFIEEALATLSTPQTLYFVITHLELTDNVSVRQTAAWIHKLLGKADERDDLLVYLMQKELSSLIAEGPAIVKQLSASTPSKASGGEQTLRAFLTLSLAPQIDKWAEPVVRTAIGYVSSLDVAKQLQDDNLRMNEELLLILRGVKTILEETTACIDSLPSALLSLLSATVRTYGQDSLGTNYPYNRYFGIVAIKDVLIRCINPDAGTEENLSCPASWKQTLRLISNAAADICADGAERYLQNAPYTCSQDPQLKNLCTELDSLRRRLFFRASLNLDKHAGPYELATSSKLVNFGARQSELEQIIPDIKKTLLLGLDFAKITLNPTAKADVQQIRLILEALMLQP